MNHLILKTLNSEGKAYGDFIWPQKGPVEAPDWESTPKCGGGLHGLLNGRGNLRLLNWRFKTIWILFEAESLVDLGENAKAPKGNVIYYGDQKGALQILAEKAGLSLRDWICQDSQWAYHYALFVDKGPRDDTREGACKDPHWACYYAICVDRAPRDDTRTAASKHPKWASKYTQWEESRCHT